MGTDTLSREAPGAGRVIDKVDLASRGAALALAADSRLPQLRPGCSPALPRRLSPSRWMPSPPRAVWRPPAGARCVYAVRVAVPRLRGAEHGHRGRAPSCFCGCLRRGRPGHRLEVVVATSLVSVQGRGSSPHWHPMRTTPISKGFRPSRLSRLSAVVCDLRWLGVGGVFGAAADNVRPSTVPGVRGRQRARHTFALSDAAGLTGRCCAPGTRQERRLGPPHPSVQGTLGRRYTASPDSPGGNALP